MTVVVVVEPQPSSAEEKNPAKNPKSNVDTGHPAPSSTHRPAGVNAPPLYCPRNTRFGSAMGGAQRFPSQTTTVGLSVCHCANSEAAVDSRCAHAHVGTRFSRTPGRAAQAVMPTTRDARVIDICSVAVPKDSGRFLASRPVVHFATVQCTALSADG